MNSAKQYGIYSLSNRFSLYAWGSKLYISLPAFYKALLKLYSIPVFAPYIDPYTIATTYTESLVIGALYEILETYSVNLHTCIGYLVPFLTLQ